MALPSHPSWIVNWNDSCARTVHPVFQASSRSSSLQSVHSLCTAPCTSAYFPSRPSSVTLLGFASSESSPTITSGDYLASCKPSPEATPPPPYIAPMANLANEPTEEQPMSFVNGNRVHGLLPPVVFNCSINFLVFLSDKNKCNETSWVPLKPISDLSVLFNSRNNVTWEGFVKMIADECNKDYNYIGRMISDGTHSSPATMTWTAFILKNKKLPKNSLLTIFDNVSLVQWMSEINNSQQSKGGLMIRMDNPRDEVTRAHRENLLAKTMKRIDSRHKQPHKKDKPANACSDEELSSGPEFDDLDVHSNDIYTKYGVNADYDQIHPVFLDPTNADRYILLTSGNVDKWAKALSMRTPGVSLTSPPPTLKFLNRRQTRKGTGDRDPNPVPTGPILDFTRWLSQQSGGSNCSSPPSSVYGNTTSNLANYLEFIMIAPHKREGILNTLLHNDIDCYQMFKRLGVEELKSLGFNVGIITKLRSNVAQYKCYLAQLAQKNAA
ncbi:hypothetical protein PCANC_27674 [Puccinia coronata f. sp. avenae]|uniref:Uncharacterized protein n=1 Tax=Puccinia coronata f. sp. avenae TaxID=200324 RepID=A0A2N5S4V4_9BASI|nr:hypothetical protein PCANC_27674 [Puccinia coronata f. sp. avenae]